MNTADMIKTLEESGGYRVRRRLKPRDVFETVAPGQELKIAVLIDLETTGLVPFRYWKDRKTYDHRAKNNIFAHRGACPINHVKTVLMLAKHWSSTKSYSITGRIGSAPLPASRVQDP